MFAKANKEVAVAYFHNKGSIAKYFSPNSTLITRFGKSVQNATIIIEITAIYRIYLNNIGAVDLFAFLHSTTAGNNSITNIHAIK